MGIREWIIPQDKLFFTLLEKESLCTVKSAQILHDLLSDYKNIAKYRKELKALEHTADQIVQDIYIRLCQTFITPIDHEDIISLSQLYDEVIDYVYGVANQLYLNKVSSPPLEMKKFSRIILKQTKEIHFALGLLKKMNKKDNEDSWQEVHHLENEADQLLDKTVGALFLKQNALEILRLKGIYDFLETATDRCEEVSDQIRNIVMKNL